MMIRAKHQAAIGALIIGLGLSNSATALDHY